MHIKVADNAAIAAASQLLKAGRLVAFPTETVYGLGGDANNPDAVAQIFAAKGRPADHPLIVHIPAIAALSEWAVMIPDSAYKLAECFWPGPLTLVLNKHSKVSDTVTGGQDSIALRIPGHPVALALLQHFDGGIAAPSANRFGRISPTMAQHVAEELDGTVDLVLDGGPCEVGLESTILDLRGGQPALLRPGRISASQIASVLATEVLSVATSRVRAPGMLPSHYAPVTPALLCPDEILADRIANLVRQHKQIGVLRYHARIDDMPGVRSHTLAADPADYAHDLYAALRELDRQRLDLILVEQPPENENWQAVNDRLRKATAGAKWPV